MKRLLLLLASLAALSVCGCGVIGFEPGVGFYWNRPSTRFSLALKVDKDLEDCQHEVGPPAGGYPPGYEGPILGGD